MKNAKRIYDMITEQAHRTGWDAIRVWNEWLQYMCDCFCLTDGETASPGELAKRLARFRTLNEAFFAAMMIWIQDAADSIERNESRDLLGELYEECFQSTVKAKSSGQFFTPAPLCEALAGVADTTGGGLTVEDCACGSGRTLLAHWQDADRHRPHIYHGSDIDTTSVNMCALNMMINGMVGFVSCMDTLTDEWRWGYEVNLERMPLPAAIYRLRKVDDREQMRTDRRRTNSLAPLWGRYLAALE